MQMDSFLLYCLAVADATEEASKFERLYMRYRQAMFYAANQILKDPILAEDAVQEAFLRVLRNLEKINEQSSHKTKVFMVVIVRNISINMYNKRKKRDEACYDEAIERMDSKATMGQEGESLLVSKIKELPELYAHTLTLRYLYEQDDKACAALLGISQAAVRKRLERGRALLKESLEQEGVFV